MIKTALKALGIVIVSGIVIEDKSPELQRHNPADEEQQGEPEHIEGQAYG